MLKQEKISSRRKNHTSVDSSTRESSSLRRATDILQCLSNDISTLTDVSSYLGYSTSTVHRLLQNLNALGWVIQDKNMHKYYLGPLVTKLSSNQIAAHKYLIMHAIHDMNHLSGITGETISLVVMVQLRHVLLHEISSTYNLKITQESNITSSSYAGAVAKTLLAQLDDKELKVTLKHAKYDRSSGKPATDLEKMMLRLNEIRHDGYCVTCGERTPGSLCISAPIKNYIYPATLNILGPEERLKPHVCNYIKELLISTGRISEDITGVFD
jgi:IclR family KDG regulon transcriptional repressor